MAPHSREAVSSIRGYYYQVLWTLLRWLELDDSYVMMMEGQEDIDRIVTGTNPSIISEQIKLRELSNVRHVDVVQAVGNFVDGYIDALATGKHFLGILRSNAASPQVQDRELRKWISGQRRNHRLLAATLKNHLPEHRSRLQKLVRERRFVDFCDSVKWAWNAPSVSSIEQTIRSKLSDHTFDGRLESTLGSLVATVLRRSASHEREHRLVTRADLEIQINDLLLGDPPDTPDSGVPAMGWFESDTRSFAALVFFASEERLKDASARQLALAQASGGGLRTDLDMNSLLIMDVVVLASSSRRSRKSLERVLRDVTLHGVHRWNLRQIRIQPPGLARTPKGADFGFSADDSIAARTASALAEALYRRVHEGSTDLPALASKVRWVHLMNEREYWTQQTHPYFLPP